MSGAYKYRPQYTQNTIGPLMEDRMTLEEKVKRLAGAIDQILVDTLALLDTPARDSGEAETPADAQAAHNQLIRPPSETELNVQVFLAYQVAAEEFRRHWGPDNQDEFFTEMYEHLASLPPQRARDAIASHDAQLLATYKARIERVRATAEKFYIAGNKAGGGYRIGMLEAARDIQAALEEKE